jgi:hypothetical protein
MLSRSPRKVKAERERKRKEEREITVLIEATIFAMQPVCNAAHAAHAAHALCSDQYFILLKRHEIDKILASLA